MVIRSAGVVAAVVLSSSVLSSSAAAQDAVQWRVEDGGNGHWYQVHLAGFPVTWDMCRSIAENSAGYLATLTSAEEHQFVGTYASQFPKGWTDGLGFGPVLGARQTVVHEGADANWAWITGEPWSFTAWGFGEPNDATCGSGGESYLAFITPSAWNDVQDVVQCSYGWLVPSYLIEWSADCNSDGIVDYGQIRAGELVDANANNIPDCCETGASCDPCSADVVEDGVVNAVDLAAVINAWGTAGGKLPRSDVDGSGLVDGADLASVLSSWGACP
jgi:hypothetical protein